MQRVDKLEEKIESKMSEEEVRQLLTDKLDPIQKELNNIQDSTTRILYHILEMKKEE